MAVFTGLRINAFRDAAGEASVTVAETSRIATGQTCQHGRFLTSLTHQRVLTLAKRPGVAV
jgi:hypothetical protein